MLKGVLQIGKSQPYQIDILEYKKLPKIAIFNIVCVKPDNIKESIVNN